MATSSVTASKWLERVQTLKAEGWWLADLCGVDRLRTAPSSERFEIVVQLLNHDRKQRQTIHVVAEGEPPTIPSVTEVWPSADFLEREAFDMFGIVFEGHPNLTRILMPDEWEGHPLRKDYGVGKVAVEFVEQPLLQVAGPGQAPDPLASRATVDRLGQVIEQGDAP